ncbi:hypothetical protein BZG36_04655 [Bifiguratus adelaidae]|uniref:NEDD8-activating enzyme E1 catalytic subunit n=1 Tax=Bifiguratus adelaidae TaxID=1938954 RepID=A0A261Y0B6_9FUNG|nr:hypothetical protein BZG36_04655 [Bifiguratus adelaidae]
MSPLAVVSPPTKWHHVSHVIDRKGPFCEDDFEGGQEVKSFLESCKVLVVGAGGLGCEILKNLALSGFRDIHASGMDWINDGHHLSLYAYRQANVGRPKALVAAEFIMKRITGVTVTPFYGKIQDKDEDYYRQFHIIVCGLDSISARRWMNATLVNMVDEDDPESVKPMIDGGTEGFKGQARVILPTLTSCYECSLDMFNKPTSFPICTIANTPRLPEHCIEWASVLEWPRVMGEEKYDTDNPEHIQWLYETALKRAQQFSIQGVTYSLTQGVVKNIIPAIASTNAIIAAACCNEAFKIATRSAPFLNNYMMYNGNDGVYTYTFEHQKKPDCPVCGIETINMTIRHSETLQEFIERLQNEPSIKLQNPVCAPPLKPCICKPRKP